MKKGANKPTEADDQLSVSRSGAHLSRLMIAIALVSGIAVGAEYCDKEETDSNGANQKAAPSVERKKETAPPTSETNGTKFSENSPIDKATQAKLEPYLGTGVLYNGEIIRRGQMTLDTLGTRSAEGVRKFLEATVREGASKGKHPAADQRISQYFRGMLASGIFEDIERLSEVNRKNSKKGSLVLVPQYHSGHTSTDPKWEKQVLRSQDETRMIATILNGPHTKYFAEGSGHEGVLDGEKYRQDMKVGFDAVISSFDLPQENTDAMAGRSLTDLQQSKRSWILDPKFRVYGSEQQKFNMLVAKLNGSMDNIMKHQPELGDAIAVQLNGYLRERYLIEKIVHDMSDGDRNVIVWGAAHQFGISALLNMRYPKLKYEMLIPKSLGTLDQ